MAHITSLSAGLFTYLDVFTGDASGLPAVPAASDYAALYNGGTADTTRMPSVREFPAFGDAPNITNVPVYGQRSSSQVSGQSDSPNFEVTVNYVAADMTAIHDLVRKPHVFRILMSTEEVSVTEAGAATLAKENTEFYFRGKIEAIQVTPSLTDTPTATITISRQGDFVGPATISAT